MKLIAFHDLPFAVVGCLKLQLLMQLRTYFDAIIILFSKQQHTSDDDQV